MICDDALTRDHGMGTRGRFAPAAPAMLKFLLQGLRRPLTESPPPNDPELAALAASLDQTARKRLGRSLSIRQVDAGSCNGCEVEINGLNSPVYDLERFGIHFVASPRHADLLLVTGPVTRNMELAVRKTYEAVAEPKLVLAVGACAISGGPFFRQSEQLGGAASVLPVDLFIPGCPPHPLTLLDGMLRLLGRLKQEGRLPTKAAK